MNPLNARHARHLVLGAAVALGYVLGRRLVPRYSFAGRVVVITGGSRGFGLVLARELAREGARLALLARDEGELERARRDLVARGATVLVLRCDVRRHGEVEQVIERVVERYGRIDVLVNNAGEIDVGPLEHMRLQDFDAAVAIHLKAPLHAILTALPHLERAGGGRIVNIASIGGRLAMPHLAPYCASKFALVGLSQALRLELRRRGVLVTTVCPGLMRTGSPYHARFRGQAKKEYAWFAISDGLPVVSIGAERMATRVIEACRDGRAQLTTPFAARAAEIVGVLAPELTARALELAAACLPGPTPDGSSSSRLGRESASRLAPSFLTWPTDQAARENNEDGAGSPQGIEED